MFCIGQGDCESPASQQFKPERPLVLTSSAAAQAKSTAQQGASRRTGTRKARAPEAKQARAEALMLAAEEALTQASYHDITILEIAKRAGLAKGTVYLYYPSKEALFLAVLTRKIDMCFDTLEARFSEDDKSPEFLARAMTDALLEPHALLNLLSLLYTQLEPGAGMEAVIAFKTHLMGRMQTIGAALEKACGLEAGGGRTLLTRAYALAIGLQQFSTPPPEFLAELQRLAPELKKEPLDVERELMDSLTDMIRARQRG
jgi:AcrR family transcriptional regulator